MPTLTIGEHAPSITLPDLQGRLHVLSDYLGRIVGLYFWSATCPHCERADQALLRLLPLWGERVTVLWVACTPTASFGQIEAVGKRRGLPVILHDAEGVAALRFGVQVTPHVFVMDANGVLRYQGAFDNVSLQRVCPTRCYLQEAVEALLAGQTPALTETAPFGCAIPRF